jgi:hypothetical protein
MNGVFVSSMLFVNYEIMLCNIFKLLNVIIGLVIMFGVIFCSTYGLQCACKITYARFLFLCRRFIRPKAD